MNQLILHPHWTKQFLLDEIFYLIWTSSRYHWVKEGCLNEAIDLVNRLLEEPNEEWQKIMSGEVTYSQPKFASMFEGDPNLSEEVKKLARKTIEE